MEKFLLNDKLFIHGYVSTCIKYLLVVGFSPSEKNVQWGGCMVYLTGWAG
jgi:hypothetical protein